MIKRLQRRFALSSNAEIFCMILKINSIQVVVGLVLMIALKGL